MSRATDLIQSYHGLSIGDEDFGRVLDLIDSEPSQSARHESIAHALRVIDLSPAQVAAIAQTRHVRDSVGLQLVVKRFVRDREYAAARQEYARRSEWRKVMELLSALPF